MNFRKIIQFIIIASIISSGFIISSPHAMASREDIISDAVFTNEYSMTESQILSFINQFPKSCLNPANYPAGLSPVSFLEPIDYFNYGSQVHPARIIYKAAKLYHLNPQAILATLEKEQGLVTGNTTYGSCSRLSYNSAMGYNCPDGSESARKAYPNIGIGDDQKTCVQRESNATFSRQVNHATWQLRFDQERAYGNTSWGGDDTIFYSGRMTEGVRARVGGGTTAYYDGYTTIDGVGIKLANGATAALYNYTPHFNSFERIFTQWFGATHQIPISGCSESTNTTLVCVWKARNSSTGAEMITSDYNTIVSWVNGKGYGLLGKSFFGKSVNAPGVGNIPIYSLTQKISGETFITASLAEYNAIATDTTHWSGDGISFYADPAGSNTGYQVYRMYNPTTGEHVWTIYASDVSAYINAGFTSEGIAFTSINSVRPESPPPAGQSLVYRFGGMPGNTHFWTKDISERDRMIFEGYSYEGVAWRVTNAATSMPIYRMYSPVIKRHLYSNDLNEVNNLKASGNWQLEGIAWYGDTSGQPVYRMYSPINNEHLYSFDTNEVNYLVSQKIFYNEGPAWYQP